MMTIQDKIENLQEHIRKRAALMDVLDRMLNPSKNESIEHVHLDIKQGNSYAREMPLRWHEIEQMLRQKVREIDSVCSEIIHRSEKFTEELDIKDLDGYQLAASEFYVMDPAVKIWYTALGLNGEAGEVADKIKKQYRDFQGEFSDSAKEAIALELGDCLWYIAVLAEAIGYKLSEVANMNIDKLTGRLSRGTIGGEGDDR